MGKKRRAGKWLSVPLFRDLFSRFVGLLFYCLLSVFVKARVQSHQEFRSYKFNFICMIIERNSLLLNCYVSQNLFQQMVKQVSLNCCKDGQKLCNLLYKRDCTQA